MPSPRPAHGRLLVVAPGVSERVLDRLAKLLAVADDGSNEHESTLAAERAAKLMAEHQISAADIRARGSVKPTVEKGRIDADGDDFSRVEAWHKALGAVVADAMGGRMWLYGKGRNQQFMMVGPPDSVSSARYVYQHLERQVNKLSRAAMRAMQQTQNAWRRAYALGMVTRINERMREGRRSAMSAASTTAMVHVDAQRVVVDEAYDALDLRKSKFGKLRRPDASDFGYHDGDDVDLGSADAKRLGEGQRKLNS